MEDVFGGPLNPGPQVAYVSDDDDADVGADGLPGDASDDDDAVVNWTMYFVKMRKAAAVGAMTVLGFLAPFLAGFPLPFCVVCALALRIRARKRDMDFLRGRMDGPAWGFDHYFSEDYPDMRFQEDFKVAKSTAAALRDALLFVGLENARGLIEVLDLYATARAPTLAHTRISTHARSREGALARMIVHTHTHGHTRDTARSRSLTQVRSPDEARRNGERVHLDSAVSPWPQGHVVACGAVLQR